MADRWLGRVLDTLDEQNLWDDTVFILSTDHGHYLGDHGWIGKPMCPVYDTLTHIPLIMWWPGCESGTHCSAITQTIDLYPTALEMMGYQAPDLERVHGRSFAPLLRGETNHHRDYAISGYYGGRVAVRSEGWTLLRAQDGSQAPLYEYTHDMQVMNRSWACRRREPDQFVVPNMTSGTYIPGLEMPVWRIPEHRTWGEHPDMLFGPTDAGQRVNIAADQGGQIKRLEEILRTHMQQRQVPEELFARFHID